MANRYLNPIHQGLDANGDALVGAKLSFFEAFTTTPITVYSDSNLTTPLTQPVIADGAGRFPEIFLDGSSHRVVFDDANDVNIATYEPVTGNFLTNTPTLFTRIVEKFTATAGQTVFNLGNSYTPGQDELQVTINGVFQVTPENYTETDSTTITFVSGLDAGDFVVVSNLKNSDISVQLEKQTATEGQTLFTLTTFTYTIGDNKLLVYVNGILQTTPEGYAETSTSSVTFVSGLTAGDFVVFYKY